LVVLQTCFPSGNSGSFRNVASSVSRDSGLEQVRPALGVHRANLSQFRRSV